MPETAEAISEKPEVRKELQRATGEKPRQKVKARGRDKFWFVAYALILGGCVVLYFLIGAKLVPLPQLMVDVLRRILRGTGLIVVVLGIAKAVSVYALGRIEDASTRFTLQRVVHLGVAFLIALIVISIIFVNWYAGIAALGVWISRHRAGCPNTNEKFHRLDIHPGSPAFSRRRSDQDRRRNWGRH